MEHLEAHKNREPMLFANNSARTWLAVFAKVPTFVSHAPACIGGTAFAACCMFEFKRSHELLEGMIWPMLQCFATRKIVCGWLSCLEEFALYSKVDTTLKTSCQSSCQSWITNHESWIVNLSLIISGGKLIGPQQILIRARVFENWQP